MRHSALIQFQYSLFVKIRKMSKETPFEANSFLNPNLRWFL